MEKPASAGPRKIVRAPQLKRGRENVVPLNDRVKLERVLGLTVTNNSSLDCDPVTSVVAYPAGCVIVLYNVRKNRQEHITSTARKEITSLSFSWDGRYLATGECGHQPHLRVWDVQEKTQVAEFLGHKFGINCVAFSPNLKYVVSIGSQHDMIVNVWDWKNNVKVASNKVSAKVKAVSFSSGGNYFVTVGNRHVKFWYLEYSRSTKYKLEPVPLMGRSAILGDQRNNYFCDVACGRGNMAESTYAITKSGLLCEFNGRRLLDKWVELKSSSANSLYVSQELILVGCAEGLVRCFSPYTLHFVCTLPRPHYLGIDVAKGLSGSHAGSHPPDAKYPDTIAVAVDENNKKVTCIYNDHSMYVWDIRDMKKVGKSHSFLYHSACIWGVEMCPILSDGKKSVLPPGTFLTCSSDDTIRVWNLEPGMRHDTAYRRNIYSTETLKILYMDPELSYLCNVDFNASGSNDKVDTTCDGKNGVRCLRINPEGRHLAAGDRSGNIKIYDLEFMDEHCQIEAHDSEVLCLEYSRCVAGKQYLASASRDRLIHIFDAAQEYAFQQTLADHSSSITAVRFVQQQGNSPLQLVSCGADKSIIFRRAQFNPQFSLSREHHVVSKTTLYDMEIDDSQQNVLTACQDRNIRVYGLQNGKQSRCFRGSQGEDGTLIKVVLDTSGGYVATSCTDKTLYVYDFASAECVACMYGHSEIVTGLKFTNDGKRLISVSGDGCIFVWTLPTELSNDVKQDGVLPTIWQDGNRNVGITKPIQSLDNEKKNSADELDENGLAYRFSVGQLPLWAKKQIFEDLSSPNANSKPEKTVPVQPRGRWAQRIEGQGMVVKSYLESDAVINFPNPKGPSGLKEFQHVRELILNNSQGKQDFAISEDSLREITSGVKQVKTGRVTLRGESDRNRHPTDSSSASSLKLEDVEAEDECSDTESSGLVYYPPSEDGSEGGDSQYRVCATNEDDLRDNRKRLRRSRPDRLRDLGTPESGDVNSDEDDASTPVESEKSFLSNFSVSTENLERLDLREKFMKSNYESLARDSPNKDDINRSSLSAKYHAISDTPLRKEIVRDTPQKTQVHSKKREELTKALNEAKKKLETLGFRGGLSSSKSIGDLHGLPDKDTSFLRSRHDLMASDIRRTSSLSDLSFSTPTRRILPTTPSNTSSNDPAPLWKQASPLTKKQQPIVSVAPSPAGRNNLPRSGSVGCLRPVAESPGRTLGRVPASPRHVGPLSKTSSSSNINSLGRRLSFANVDIQQLHSDDSSPDLSPTTEKPRPLPSLSKSFGHRPNSLALSSWRSQAEPSRSKSERDLRGVGRGDGLYGRGLPLPDLKWSRRTLPDNPLVAPLSQELCEDVAEELRRITAYAMEIFQRVTMNPELSGREKSTLTTCLAQGVLQAQQTLRPAAPLWTNGSEAMTKPSDAMALLQQYSDRLLNMVEQRFSRTQNKSD